MELTQLRYFLTVANCGQIARAAELLHISQSAVSMSISRLENELDVELFERKGRYIYLTQTGEEFRKLVTAPMAELDFAREEIRKISRIEPNTIEVSLEMPDFATRFQQIYYKRHPNALFQQSMDPTEMVKQKLLCAKVDFTLTFEPFNEPNVTSILLLEEPVYIQLPPGHPLYQRECARLSEFSEDPFVSFNKGYSFRRWMDGMCFFAGFRPKLCFEVCDTQSLLHTVDRTGAVTFVAGTTSEINHESSFFQQGKGTVRDVLLEDDFCKRRIYLSYHKDRILSPEAKNFLDFALRFKSAYERFGSMNKTGEWLNSDEASSTMNGTA